jgi:hypothetical protein
MVQSLVALSTTESEYIVVAEVAKKSLVSYKFGKKDRYSVR